MRGQRPPPLAGDTDQPQEADSRVAQTQAGIRSPHSGALFILDIRCLIACSSFFTIGTRGK